LSCGPVGHITCDRS